MGLFTRSRDHDLSPLELAVRELEDVEHELEDLGPDEDEERGALNRRREELERRVQELRGDDEPMTRAEAGSRTT